MIVAALALAAAILASWDIPGDRQHTLNAVTTFLVLGVIAEAGFLRIGVGGSSSSVAFVPYLAAVVLFPPAWAMLIGGSTQLIAETFIRKKPLIKVIYNSSKELLAVGAAAACYSLLGGTPTIDAFLPNVLAFLAASVLYFLISQSTAVVAIGLSSGAGLADTWARVVGSSLLYDAAAGPVAIFLAWLYVKLNLIGVLVVILPLLLIRHMYQMNLRLEQVNADLLELMVKAIEARDPYTSGHSLRVSRIAKAIARELGLPVRTIERISTAALLHDVGKIYEEFAPLLRKEGKLLPHEQRLMQSHPVRSSELVRTISIMRGDVELAVRHHHECYDGTGYPDGLAGDQIPIASRIISIADTVDAMTTDRPYRDALPYERVTLELQAFRGRQFDPRLVDIFCNSRRIQMLVGTYLRRPDPAKPKSVAETFDDLRRALGSNS